MFGGDKKADCPLWKAPCKEHACRWYIQVQGKNPQSEEIISRWDCAISWLPILLVENGKDQRHTGAAVESLRNETVVAHAQDRTLLAGLMPPDLKLIEN